MRKRIAVVVGAITVLLAVMSPASAGVDRIEIPIDGDYFECGAEIYTVVEGSIAIAVHEIESASGNMNLNVSIRPRGHLVDGSGASYKLVGAESVHISAQQSGNLVVQEVFHATIVAEGGGGAVGRVGNVLHLSVNANGVTELAMDTGTCVGPLR